MDRAKRLKLGTFFLIAASFEVALASDARASTETEALERAYAALALPLESGEDLSPLLDRIGDIAYVLLGESTHGTSEYYHWRDQISRRLIEEKGFRFIAVEGDWEACYRLNRYVKHLPGAGDSARSILESLDRWPRWMWANEEVETLIEWLHEYNKDQAPEARVGFYGIDLYGHQDSMEAVLAYLREVDPDGAAQAEEAYNCLRPYAGSFQSYARAAQSGLANCEEAVQSVVSLLAQKAGTYKEAGPGDHFNAKLNAVVVQNAEAHYRAMGRPDGDSWNLRVDHFLETVERLMDYKGEGAKGVVWAHNTHVGDARATGMADRGSTNIGQLLRQRHGKSKVFALGFGTHRGTVLAGRAWESPMERMTIPRAMAGSTEDLLHKVARRLEKEQFLLLFDHEDWSGALGEWRGHRAIGVSYNPSQEQGNYVPTMLPLRYDGFIFIDETKALTPVHP